MALRAQVNQALTFAQSGDMDQIQVPPSLLTNCTGNFTINLRVNFFMLNHWHMLATNNTVGAGIELSYYSNLLTFTTDGSSLNVAIQHQWFPAANTWYMVTLVRNGNLYKLFVDGVLLGQNVSSAPYPNYDLQGLRIGNYYAAQATYNFRGKMDDFSFWNTAVSDAFVQDSLLNNSFALNAPGLVLYFDMDTTGAGAGIQVSNRGGQGGAAMNGVTVGSLTTPFFTPNLVLPVTLASFQVEACGPSVCLNWMSTSETLFSHYEVERSADARAFEPIAQVAAGGGQQEQRYALSDHHPLSGMNYYRLKCVDQDGHFSYSAVLSWQAGTTQNLQVIPQGHGRFLLSAGGQVSDLRVFNLWGAELPVSKGDLVDLSAQPTGLYVIRCMVGRQAMAQTAFKP